MEYETDVSFAGLHQLVGLGRRLRGSRIGLLGAIRPDVGGFIVVDDRAGELRFRHPMIKSVVVERSTHDERRKAHLRLAERFADQPERRGHHLAGPGREGAGGRR